MGANVTVEELSKEASAKEGEKHLQLERIVVTAQKKAHLLQNVPSSVYSFRAYSIEDEGWSTIQLVPFWKI
tara:strand:+ start:15811 stop:16023 length:213 start_codon:yes stop_codon:yes gene_type:complete